MISLYNIIIFLSSILIFIGSFFSKKLNLLYNGRKKIKKYFKIINITNEKKIWIHVSSVGEFEQAKSIIYYFKNKSKLKIFITFFSPSAEKVIKKFKLVDYSCYLPEDSKNKISYLYKKINPKILLLIKYEFWYHLINEGNKINIPVVSISSIFRKNQIYFNAFSFFSKPLKKINYYYVQNEESKSLLKSIDIINVIVVGDTRFDRVYDIYKESKNYPKIENFIKKSKTLIIGSSWKSDINILKNGILNSNKLKFIIAPHNVNENEIVFIENLFLNNTIRYSNLEVDNSYDKNILIIDNIGMLSSIYRYGNIAYIGGGFEGTLHNSLEAAIWDLPILYGNHKNNQKFNEIRNMEKLELTFPINSTIEYEKKINELLNKKNTYGTKKYVLNNIGATKLIFKSLNRLLK
tara:strand:- start:18801 stop:20021 length:1221 start_codon:yes stop_codon:yes gene_type:complete